MMVFFFQTNEFMIILKIPTFCWSFLNTGNYTCALLTTTRILWFFFFIIFCYSSSRRLWKFFFRFKNSYYIRKWAGFFFVGKTMIFRNYSDESRSFVYRQYNIITTVKKNLTYGIFRNLLTIYFTNYRPLTCIKKKTPLSHSYN